MIFSARLLIFICFMMISASLIGQSEDYQSKIDSLRALLDTDLKPIQRINKNLKLVSLYKYSHPDVDSLISSSLALAEKNGLKFYIARSLRFRARYKIYLNAPAEDILLDIKRIDSLSQKMDNKLLPGWVSSLSAHYNLLIGNLVEAKVNIDSLDRQLNDNKYANRGTYYTILGMYYQQKKDYKKAIEEYKNALKFIESGRTFIYNNLARLHLELQNTEEALGYANKSIAYGSTQKNIITRIDSEIIKGEIYLFLEDTVQALAHFEESERLRNRDYYTKNYSAIHKLIDIYKNTNPTKADSLLQDISAYKFIDIYPILLIEKGVSLFKKGKVSESITLCAEGIALAEKRYKYKYAVRGCDCLINIYKSRNDQANLAANLEQKIKYQALLNDENRILSLARNVANYESEKENALVKQAFEKDQEILKERLGKFRLGGLMGLLILGIGGFTLWKLRNKNHEIASQNKVISKALSEKDILLREIHHRVKNNLQLVSSLLTLQGRSINDATAQQAINEGKSRVRSMALIHQDLYNRDNLTSINVKNYLEKLTNEIFTTYRVDKDDITLKMEIENIELDIDTVVPLGLIINELLTNCLKYAFPNGKKGEIFVGMSQNDQKLNLIVSDDGVGYDFDQVSDSSFGSTLIAALTEQLEGTMSRKLSDGTTVEIEFDLSSI